jgi:drug/metabolite transporter (DMT)-like permease
VLILGEPFHLYHALGFGIVLAGWLLTTGVTTARAR